MNYFFSICVGFLAGIVSSVMSLTDATLFFCLIMAMTIFLEARFFEKDHVRFVGMCVALFFLGVFFGQFRVLAFNHSISHDLIQFESENITFEGKIISDPIANGQTQKFTVAAMKVFTASSSPTLISGNILLVTDLFPNYHYGDVIMVTGQLQKPAQVDEGLGRVFDYPKYLLKDKITETMSFASIRETEKNEGNPLIKFLYGIRGAFVHSMQVVLPEPEAGLMAGIVLGTQTLSKSMSNDFRAAGLSHIVVLSGFNITVVSNFVMNVSLYVAPLYAPFIAVFSIILFVLMSGAGASALRAGIMVTVALLGKRFGKSYDAGRALFFAAFIMILWNPMTMLYDPSFHLSFLATVAMIYFSPTVCGWLKMVTDKFGLRDTLATTLAVNIFVLPYILYMSGSIQVLSLPANILVLPFVPVTMFLGLFVGIFGFFGRFIGLIVGIPSYIILRYDIFVAQTIAHLPFAQLSIPNFPLWLMLAIYGVFFYFLYKKNRPMQQIVTSDGYLVID